MSLSGISNRLTSSPALRSIGTMGLASAIGQVAILATTPLVTRLYAPSEFGAFALLTSFSGIATVAACLCLDLAIVQGADDAEADELFAAALRSLPVTALASALVLIALIRFRLFGFENLSLASIPIAVSLVVANGLYLASRYRQLRENRFNLIASATMFQNFGRAVAPLGWYPVSSGWIGLALGELTGRLIGTRALLAPIVHSAWRNAAFRTHVSWWRVVKREWRYTGVLLTSVLIDTSSSLIIAPMLASSYTTAVAGEYYMITTLLNAPLALVGRAFADVIHARSAHLVLVAPAALPGFVRRSAAALLFVGALIYLPIYMLAPTLFPLVFGHKWHLIVPITRALTPFMIMAFVASPCSRVLIAVRHTGVKMVSDVTRLIGAPLTIVLSSQLRMPFETAIFWLGMFLTAAYALYFAAEYLSAVYIGKRGKAPDIFPPANDISYV